MSSRDAVWMFEWMDRLAERLAATASVVAPATVDHNRELIAEHADHYPFPAWVAGSIAGCRQWLEELDQ